MFKSISSVCCVKGLLIISSLPIHIQSMMKSIIPCKLTWVTLDSPLGRIKVSGCEEGVHDISIQADTRLTEGTKTGSSDCTVQEGQEALSGQLQVCTDWLRAYFREPQVAEKLPMPCFHHPVFQEESFTSRVLHVLQRDIRLGETVSYKRLAEMSGNINAVRAVGGAMRRNPVQGQSIESMMDCGPARPPAALHGNSQREEGGQAARPVDLDGFFRKAKADSGLL
uniref:Methylated-DNA--protein-cysteine methyltransferase n=1 Tax=Scleropages formosus TaxID=113540 RepID=A0A8C9V1W7_SCLFO